MDCWLIQTERLFICWFADSDKTGLLDNISVYFSRVLKREREKSGRIEKRFPNNPITSPDSTTHEKLFKSNR